MKASERECVLALSHARFLRPLERLRVVAGVADVDSLRRLTAWDVSELAGRSIEPRSWDPEDLVARGERTARLLAAGKIGCLFRGEPGFPYALAHIYDPPATLFHRGPVPGDDQAMVAIVGTRLPTGAGREASLRLALELSRAGVVVVSGLARGVDREAHEGCVRGGSPSVAALASGVDIVSPGSSRAVARRILETGGALVSEYPPGTPPRAYLFPERNRLISGLVRSVVIVQAPQRSGALITADYALHEGRDLYVHAAGLSGNACAGTAALVEAGAPVIRSAAGILADWAHSGRPLSRDGAPAAAPPRQADRELSTVGATRRS